MFESWLHRPFLGVFLRTNQMPLLRKRQLEDIDRRRKRDTERWEMIYESFCVKCGKVLGTSVDTPYSEVPGLVLMAQIFERCPVCHHRRNSASAHDQIGVRPKLEKEKE